MIQYLESSAIGKLLFKEPEFQAFVEFLEASQTAGDTIVSSVLAETELRRAAQRLDVPQRNVTEVLDVFDLAEFDRSIFNEAGVLPGKRLRSLDALHIAIARRLGADFIVTYDNRLADAAAAAGMRVRTPGT